jgi:hypothetical protein
MVLKVFMTTLPLTIFCFGYSHRQKCHSTYTAFGFIIIDFVKIYVGILFLLKYIYSIIREFFYLNNYLNFNYNYFKC